MKKFANWAYENTPVEEANVVVLGIPLGKHADEMLTSLREASDFVDVFDVERKVNMLDNVKIADVGNIQLNSLEDITSEIRRILTNKKIPLTFSKSHLSTLYSVQAFPKNIKIISFDAHGDIKSRYSDEIIDESVAPFNFNERYSCTTWLRRVSEINGNENIAIVGLRDCDEDDFNFIENNKIFYLTPSQIKKNMEESKKLLREFVKNSDVYLSIDMDVFDPSIAPAVEHPEPNGLLVNEFLDLVDEVCKNKVVGMDLVEIKPLKDNKISEFLATEVVFQILSRIV